MPDQISAPWLIFYFFVVVAFCLGGIWWLFRWNKSTHEAALMFQSILTGAAILVAGYWYLVERRGTPHADLSQAITIVPAENGYVIVESTLTLKNLGSVLLRVKQIDVRLQRASPTGLELSEIASAPFETWPTRFRDGTRMYDGSELQWPTLQHFNKSVDLEIEPGESDTVTTTFVVSCEVNDVRLAAEVKKAGDLNLWWKTRSFASLVEACSSAPRKRGAK